MTTTETMFPDRSDFDYDYETLRTTGLTLAIVMFVGGILIALTRLASRQRQKCLLRLCEGPVSVMAPAPGENVSLWFLCSSSRCTSASDTLSHVFVSRSFRINACCILDYISTFICSFGLKS